jgi:hypothetical protein
MMYVLMLGLATLVALILRYNGDKLGLSFHGALDVHCSDAHDIHDVSFGAEHPTYIYCKGDAAVYRVSFVLAIFFAVVGLLSSCSDAFHRGWWAPKLLAFFGLLIGCFFIPNNVFDNDGYAWVARIASALFLVLQILALIDFGYQWNENWVLRATGGDGAAAAALAGDTDGTESVVKPGWLYALLGCASLLYFFACGMVVFMFASYDECGISIAITSVILLLIVLFTGLSLFRDKVLDNEEFQGAVLPASVVAAYCAYLGWSAISSHPDPICRAAGRGYKDNTTDMVLGMFIATVSLMWSSYAASHNAEELMSGQHDQESQETYKRSSSGIRTQLLGGGAGTGATFDSVDEPLYRVEDGAYGTTTANGMHRANLEALNVDASEVRSESSSVDLGASEHGRALGIFHLMMCTASMYMAMLLTNWGTNDNQSGSSDVSVGLATMWVKFVSAIITAFMFGWTLVAPAVYPEREWM